ncbi:MAG: ABC transporter transmembrane domain-containing protein, partial [Stackebrandtia sp.]
MRLFSPLPLPDPGEPDIGSAGRYLWWVMRRQMRGLLAAGVFGSAWMASIGAIPGLIGVSVDQGVAARDLGATALWAGVLAAVAAAIAGFGVIRHRLAVHNFLTGAYRTVQLTTRHATRVGAVLPRRIATGEVVAVGSNDPIAVGTTLDVLGRTIGSVVSFAAVAAILLNISPLLGTVILIGLPLQALLIGPLLKPLQRREHDYREQQGILTSRANDIVAGLRVLRGVGGESLFDDRYVERSGHVRRFGVRVAAASAVMKGLQVLLPGLLLTAVTWLGARLTASGELTPGQLVAVFGYTAFLMIPMDVFLETARKYTTGHAAAERVVRLLSVTPGVADNARGDAAPQRVGRLDDPESGLRVAEGELTAVA